MKKIKNIIWYVGVMCVFIVTQTGCSVVLNSSTSDEKEHFVIKEGESYTIDLQGASLEYVPENIYAQYFLTELDLSHNNITGSLKAEIKNLKYLTVLNLSDNSFTDIPAEVGQLHNLEILDLSNNALTGLPHEIGNLSELQVLDISGNPYSQVDVGIIKARLPKSTYVIQ